MVKERDIKWSTDFVCEIKTDEGIIICNEGGWPGRPAVKGALKGNDMIIAGIKRHKLPLSLTRVEDLDYIPIWMGARSGNIIGCCLDEGIIYCAEGAGRAEVTRDLDYFVIE